MSGDEFQWVGNDLEVQIITEAVALADAQRERIDAIWQAESQRRGQALFNGEILEFLRFEGSRILARFTEYKQYVASRVDPTVLGRDLRPLAVSGLTRCGEAIGFGRRAAQMNQYPGWLELFPSGSIDRRAARPDGTIDYRRLLILELAEETNLSEQSIGRMDAFALVLDRKDHVYDICVEITLKETDVRRLGRMESSEYTELFFVERSALRSLIDACAGQIVPTSMSILTGRGLL